MANFGGPGMHYHRRAASSPEFENPRFGIRHLNSSSTMADVFEEDEEDEWEDAKAASDKETSSKVEDDDEGGSGIDIKVVDAEDMHAGKAMDWTLDEASKRGLKRKGSGLSEGDRRQMIPSIPSANAGILLNDEVILEEGPNSVEIADDSIPPRPDSGARSSDSTATPPLPPKSAKDLTPVDIQLFSVQSPYLTPTSPHSTAQSPFPSPRSPFSYDTQRISTAPSSITDEGGFQSLLLGEPGPELRMSVDDVPSLTSSNSTMTRDSTILPMAHGTPFRDGQRSASLSSATATRKRSSMASLSRLISSSHGERSKLSIEYTPSTMTEADEKKRASKGRRISRMMSRLALPHPQPSNPPLPNSPLLWLSNPRSIATKRWAHCSMSRSCLDNDQTDFHVHIFFSKTTPNKHPAGHSRLPSPLQRFERISNLHFLIYNNKHISRLRPACS
jgi:hypothetical protein